MLGHRQRKGNKQIHPGRISISNTEAKKPWAPVYPSLQEALDGFTLPLAPSSLSSWTRLRMDSVKKGLLDTRHTAFATFQGTTHPKKGLGGPRTHTQSSSLHPTFMNVPRKSPHYPILCQTGQSWGFPGGRLVPRFCDSSPAQLSQTSSFSPGVNSHWGLHQSSKGPSSPGQLESPPPTLPATSLWNRLSTWSSGLGGSAWATDVPPPSQNPHFISPGRPRRATGRTGRREGP